MRLLNLISPGDKVTLVDEHGGTYNKGIVIEGIKEFPESDWWDLCRNQLCVYWAGGGRRWPLSLCRKAEQ